MLLFVFEDRFLETLPTKRRPVEGTLHPIKDTSCTDICCTAVGCCQSILGATRFGFCGSRGRVKNSIRETRVCQAMLITKGTKIDGEILEGVQTLGQPKYCLWTGAGDYG